MTNGEFRIELEKRTVAFSVNVLRLLRRIPHSVGFRNVRDQVARSATSIGANYREANRAESRDDFLHKISIVTKETAESEYWLLVLRELCPEIEDVGTALSEANSLLRVFEKIRLTLKRTPRT